MLKNTLCALALISITISSAIAADHPPILSQPDPDSPIGQRHPDATATLDQFGFVIGDWDVDVTLSRGDQTMGYKAEWHNIWILNGLVVFQEWRGPYSTGAEFRSYDPATEIWSGYNHYPGSRGWWPTQSEWNETTQEMVVTSHKEDQRGKAINQEIYYDITPDSFRIRSQVSYDEGKTWEPGGFEIAATRK